MRRRVSWIGVIALVIVSSWPSAASSETTVDVPSGVRLLKTIPGPNGFKISFSAERSYVVAGDTNYSFICPDAFRETRPNKTTKVVSEVYVCDMQFDGYRFDPQTWTGSAIGEAVGRKSISTWKYASGEWKRVSHAERETRTRLNIRWAPAGPVEPDVFVYPNVGICYWLFVVCPPIVKAAADRDITLSGSMYFEAFSMSVKLPKSLPGRAWLVVD